MKKPQPGKVSFIQNGRTNLLKEDLNLTKKPLKKSSDVEKNYTKPCMNYEKPRTNINSKTKND